MWELNINTPFLGKRSSIHNSLLYIFFYYYHSYTRGEICFKQACHASHCSMCGPQMVKICILWMLQRNESWKKWEKMKMSSRNARKPNSLFENWHISLLITSDSRNSLRPQQLCQSPVNCAINVIKSKDGWLLIKKMKSRGGVLFYEPKLTLPLEACSICYLKKIIFL